MGGQSLMPEEIDEVLAAHPAVMDVATVGISHPDFGEVAISAVVLSMAASEHELTEHCRRRLEHLKVPKRILVLEKIPRGGAGKPKTAELRELLAPLISGLEATPASADVGVVSAEPVYELATQVFQVPARELDASSSPATVVSLPSSVARGLFAGATAVERVDKLIQTLAGHHGMSHKVLNRIVADVSSSLESNRAAADEESAQ